MMDFKIISETENPLFNRKAIEGELYADKTPSREEVAKFLSEKFSAPIDTIKIRTIKGKFGSKVFLIVANIYKTKEDKDRIEHKKKKDTELEKKAEQAEKAAEEEAKKSDESKEETVGKKSEENKEEAKG